MAELAEVKRNRKTCVRLSVIFIHKINNSKKIAMVKIRRDDDINELQRIVDCMVKAGVRHRYVVVDLPSGDIILSTDVKKDQIKIGEFSLVNVKNTYGIAAHIRNILFAYHGTCRIAYNYACKAYGYPPPEEAYIATVVKNNMNVKIYDRNVINYYNRIRKKLKKRLKAAT